MCHYSITSRRAMLINNALILANNVTNGQRLAHALPVLVIHRLSKIAFHVLIKSKIYICSTSLSYRHRPPVQRHFYIIRLLYYV